MRRVETIFIILALAFYAWFLTHFGFRETLGYLRLAGWGLAVTIALEAIARAANAVGWRVTIEHYPPSLSFFELYAARIGGEAIDYTTPSAQLGGQFVMALMVRRKLRMPVGLATVAVSALAEGIGQITFITLALVLASGLIPAAAGLLWPIVAGFLIAAAMLCGFLFVQMKRPFRHLWRFAAKLDLSRFDTSELGESADEADAILLDFYRRHRGRLILSCLCFLVAWSLGPIEIYILLRLLHQPATVRVAILVEALGLLIERATFLIPAKLVSQEGGKALILGLLGYPPGAGFAVGFLRRIKEMVWVMFGLVALMIHRAIERGGIGVAAAAAPGLQAPAPKAGEILEIRQAQGEQSL
ncbi:MAG TPA: lysylphosphatidylglycerol synthase domain-containing protein [Candidatus Binataceae bacterium]